MSKKEKTEGGCCRHRHLLHLALQKTRLKELFLIGVIQKGGIMKGLMKRTWVDISKNCYSPVFRGILISTAGVMILFSTSIMMAQALPNGFQKRLKSASISVVDSTISVSTGKIERKWNLNNAGLKTVSIKDLSLNKEWATNKNSAMCDWNLPKAIDANTEAKLVSFDVKESDDDGFVSPHLALITQLRYESAKLEVQHVVWVFPDAPGVRTQLRVKALEGFDPKGLPEKETSKNFYGHTLSVPSGQTEFLPLDFSVKNERLYWGYYNDPGSRHDQSRDMLKEERILGYPVFQIEDIDWASGIGVDYGGNGVSVVKESHKCVNQQGHNTGSFYVGPKGLAVTGWGLQPKEIVTDRFRECWATWTIVYSGGNDGLQLALKRFDRARYPIFPDRDMMIINDTWGPANPGGGQFAKEDYLLKEIPLLSDLGVDVLRIDDGWQIHPWGGVKEVFLPSYPDTWKNINDACQKYGVKLGLWIAVQRAKQKDLLWNLEKANVVTWKVDFDHLNDKTAFENRFTKVRELMKNAWMKTQFSFCPEYNHPRYGWYYAKEYGSIYFQNLQEALPEHLTMVPYHVLRQNWLMSKYFNSNKLQVLLQNPKRVNRDRSDAYLHSHAYCFAQGVPFVPVFFQGAQYLDEAGRKELKTFIAMYKAHRKELFLSYCFPIGDTPTNESYTGYQFISENSKEGYFLIFRELHNKEKVHNMCVKFLSGKELKLFDIRTGKRVEKEVSKNGMLQFEIENPADYLFLKYEIK